MKRFFGRVGTPRVAVAVAALALVGATLAAQSAPQARRPAATQIARPTPAAPAQAAPPAQRRVAPAQATAQDSLPQTIVFNRDIRPILSDKCFKCHGPGTQIATVRFDLEDGAKHELRGGRFPVVPGDPSKSEMIRRITATDPAVRMPKSGTGGVNPGDPLSSREVALLRRWIEQGAKWEKPWQFIPPTRPAVPTVSDPKWVRNPIDAFVLQRLDREGLRPSAPADKAVLLRRVTLDLTGLPPTTLELDAFLQDTSANAYEKVVDRLLASPRYGERMAFPWLEAARYADTAGYFHDGPRFMWRWRDWVIDAFNHNMPYDQFITDQLAGDLVPNATIDQKIATGFNRNHRGNSEAGVIDAEYLVEAVADRVDTTSTVFLGLTMGCTRCHNHKYDPLTAKDYYSMFAYFNNVDERGRARRLGNSPPFVKAPTSEQQPVLKELDDALAQAKGAFDKLQPDVLKARTEWETKLDKTNALVWGPTRGLLAYYPLNGNLNFETSISRDGNPTSLKFEEGAAEFAPSPFGQAAGFDGKRFIQGGDLAGFISHYDSNNTVSFDDPYTMAAWIYPTAPTGAILTRAKADAVVDDAGVTLALKEGKIAFTTRSTQASLSEAIILETEKPITLNQWHQVTLVGDGARWASGFKVYVDGELWKWKVIFDDMNAQYPRLNPLRIGSGDNAKNRFQGNIAEVRIYNRALSAIEAAELADPKPINEIAALPDDKRSSIQTQKIRDYFLDKAAPAPIRTAFNRMLEAERARDNYYTSLPTVMVMEEMPTPRETHILVRGMFDRPGDKVTPAVPAVIAPANLEKYPPNRLGLAQYLVSAENPLTARVTVNRFWQQYFGTGIVKSVENFGSQGELPSHQELLDWLATEFVRSGWNVKALQKTIVMSATYQQTSSASHDMREKDPANRLLARGPSGRLSGEMVHDQALALAGLLTNKIGGPSVKPYQAPGLWDEASSSDGADTYEQDHGDNLYRRGLYTYWKRAAPPPGMVNFDAATREAHEVRVNVTDTPLQALDLMNDVTYVEAARVFAERVMKEGGQTPADRIAYAFRAATARRPNVAERSLLMDTFDKALAFYKKNPDQALKFLTNGESPRDPYLNAADLAAYSTVTSLIINLNQTVVKE